MLNRVGIDWFRERESVGTNHPHHHIYYHIYVMQYNRVPREISAEFAMKPKSIKENCVFVVIVVSTSG
jgi:hypothetical protein